MDSDPLKDTDGAERLARRPVRSHIKGFTLPWKMLRDSTLHFQRRMHAAREPGTDRLEAWHWDSYALAVQVFAAMAAEAQLDTYGMVRFEPALAEELRWEPVVRRLKRMASLGAGVGLADGDPLVQTLASLAEKRNPIVHMRTNEEVFDHEGHILQPAPPPPDHVGGADAAVREMDTFLIGFAALIGKHDIESWSYIAPW